MCGRYLLAIVVAALIATQTVLAEVVEAQGVKVVTTFQYLADDVTQLLCEGDEVISLVPPGVDPHEYSLTPRDVELLRNSNIVISTSHTHLESKIYELKVGGELNASVIEIPKIPNMRLRNVSGVNVINYHAITYDPDNYVTLMEVIAEELTRLRPECRDAYLEKLNTATKHVLDVRSDVKSADLLAIGSSPLIQYAVEWFGVKFAAYLVVDPEASPTPKDISNVERLLSSRSVNLTVISDGDSPHDRALMELSIKYSVPVLKVPSPISPGSMALKIKTVINNFNNLPKEVAHESGGKDGQGLPIVTLLITLIVLIIALRRVSTWR
ncbi:MAG: zinc ABC transporter substrate-binding protein [Sulfolobales archaeon]|nr:zinc ABC transporter substrate-binding protein [Sulfolobales archaeon]